MSTPSWSNLEALFHEALARKADERTAFLAERCAGHPDLQAEVEALLRAHENAASAEGSLTVPAVEAARMLARESGPLLLGGQLGSYKILSLLGAGGMGEVYRAHDPNLGRDVALKVLPRDLAQEPERRARLLREARAAASLNHSHICTIYEVGEADGQVYLAMELVEGQPLSVQLAERPLPPGTSCATGSNWPTRWRTPTTTAWSIAT